MNKNKAHVEMESITFFLSEEDNGGVESTPNL